MGELQMLGKKELFDFFDLMEKNIEEKNVPGYLNFLLEGVLNGETFDKTLIDAEILKRMYKLYSLMEDITLFKESDWKVLKRIAGFGSCPPDLTVTILTDGIKALTENKVSVSASYFKNEILWQIIFNKNIELLRSFPLMNISFMQLELLVKLLSDSMFSDSMFKSEFYQLYDACLNHRNFTMERYLEEFANS